VTLQEAQKALKELPQHMQTQQWLQSSIRYEEHKGIHTYHPCKCSRGWTRTGHCGTCIREMLAILENTEDKP
jgi:hypothetical protein